MTDFVDTGALWLSDYESATFKDDVEQLWQTLKPLYERFTLTSDPSCATFTETNFLTTDSSPLICSVSSKRF